MDNTNIQNLKIINTVTPTIYTELPDEDKPMTPDEEAKFIENIDMEEIDRTIVYLETQEDNPNAWISFDEAMEDIRRAILNE